MQASDKSVNRITSAHKIKIVAALHSPPPLWFDSTSSMVHTSPKATGKGVLYFGQSETVKSYTDALKCFLAFISSINARKLFIASKKLKSNTPLFQEI